MKYINIDKYPNKKPSFYLGIEEYFVKNKKDEYFLLWSCSPSVIIGKHQVIYNEVHSDYLRNNNINICRRFSGGGAVYADENNLMFTFILNEPERKDVFNHYLGKICKVLKESFNISAYVSGRNDLMVNGKKISGSSFYYYKNRVIFHGTLLVDVDLEKMTNILNPNRQKLEIKGIDSVRQRVINLKEIDSEITIKKISDFLIKEFCEKIIKINDRILININPYIDNLESTKWLNGKIIASNIKNKNHYNSGSYEIMINLVNNIIYDLVILGDFFTLKPLDDLISKMLNKQYEKQVIYDILENEIVGNYILGLTNEEFVNLMFQG